LFFVPTYARHPGTSAISLHRHSTARPVTYPHFVGRIQGRFFHRKAPTHAHSIGNREAQGEREIVQSL
jgi:hypothetical protein